MFVSTITVFNYHEATKTWYLSMITGVHLLSAKSSTGTTTGVNNGDTVEVIVRCAKDRSITTSIGKKQYVAPKEYGKSENPEDLITFTPETDFIYSGEWENLTPIPEDEESQGLYYEMNDEHDGVFAITSAGFFGLLPHFEIGGR